jgi:hypothetical protein
MGFQCQFRHLRRITASGKYGSNRVYISRATGSLNCMNRNSRRRIYHAVLCLLSLLSRPRTSWASGNARPQKKTEFGTGVEVGFGIAKYHHTCVIFRIFFISNEFFNGLKEIKTGGGASFQKHGTQYDKFPDHLIVDVEASVDLCASNYGTPFDYGAGLIEGASFEVNWQGLRETQTRSASLMSTKMLHRPGRRKWDYFLEIEAKDVPLTDTLDVDVSLRKGMSQASLMAGLLLK